MHIWALTKCAATHWASDQAATIGAALAFYCAFSLAPLLIILVTVTGWIVGAETAHGQLSFQLTSLFGVATANILLEAMKNSQSSNGIVATVLSIASLLVGATTVFAALLLWLYYSAQIFLLGAESTACLGDSRDETAVRPGKESHATS